MGRRSATPGRGRPLLVAILVALLVAGLGVSWFQVRDRVDRQADQAASACVAGKAVVPIAASPDIAETLAEIARRYNATHPVVRDHCLTVQVRPVDGRAALAGLRGTWDVKVLGPQPAAWIPQSSVWSAELLSDRPATAEGAPDSLVTSPVVLAVDAAFAAKAGTKLSWARLPGLAKRRDAMAEFGLPAWGALRLAMPTGPASDATALAAQAVAAQSNPPADALTGTKAKSPAAAAAIEAVLAAAPPARSAAGVVAEMGTGDPRRGIHAVPITEQQLFALTREGDLAQKVRAYSPAGPTPIADYPVVRLSDESVSAVESDGAAQFIDFARSPRQVALLVARGYRAGDATLPQGNAAVAFGPVRDPRLTAEPAAVAAVNRLVFKR
ncbi:hypothetical protein HUN08_09415 [Gordonia sp. X0973]|uniref:hypothetical protein n=1 Tax=Gordonia sp. X0973 TaxID=2742602 RepID=UPI000F548ED6|nr:hypothetical protein [Gordonia sp. X0973]QKT07386.1 hypothetical protein HUN08_09415 [Gordonia sp. X0973]